MKKIVKHKLVFNFIIFSFVLLCSGSSLRAQSDDSWTLQSEKHGIKLYYRTDSCANSNMLFLKLENTNAIAKHVNCNIIIESSVRNIPLVPLSVELKAGETKFGECNSNKELSTDIKNIINFKMVVVLTTN